MCNGIISVEDMEKATKTFMWIGNKLLSPFGISKKKLG
jgi:hypothetical protein